MRKLLFIAICCLCLCGCESNQNKELLIGEWSYEEEESKSWGNIYSYEFLSNNKVQYYECLSLTLTDDSCINGSAVWIGKYTIDDNIITLSNFEIDKTNSYNYTNKLNGPSQKLIADFDNMYICDRNKGLDCDNPFKKNTDY